MASPRMRDIPAARLAARRTYLRHPSPTKRSALTALIVLRVVSWISVLRLKDLVVLVSDGCIA